VLLSLCVKTMATTAFDGANGLLGKDEEEKMLIFMFD
jgi:hypothetical protein